MDRLNELNGYHGVKIITERSVCLFSFYFHPANPLPNFETQGHFQTWNLPLLVLPMEILQSPPSVCQAIFY